MSDKTPSRKTAADVMNGAAFIEKLIGIIESRAGRLVGAMSQGDKSWLTFERGVALHKRLSSAVKVLQAAQAVIEANIPRPKEAPGPRSLLDLITGGGDCGDPACPTHGGARTDASKLS